LRNEQANFAKLVVLYIILCMHDAISLEPISQRNFDELAYALSHDKALIKSLDNSKHVRTMSAEALFNDAIKWQSDNRANSYAIRLRNRSIGMISLSHQADASARVGYWLVSAEWRKGYATQAFRRIIEIAKQQGFAKLSGSIELSNIASKRIWDNFGAHFQEDNEILIASLKIA